VADPAVECDPSARVLRTGRDRTTAGHAVDRPIAHPMDGSGRSERRGLAIPATCPNSAASGGHDRNDAGSGRDRESDEHATSTHNPSDRAIAASAIGRADCR
jgi:hypothetical protein